MSRRKRVGKLCNDFAEWVKDRESGKDNGKRI
jgi:hypothetical protein